MTKHEVELLVKIRNDADAALNRLGSSVRAVADDATRAGVGFDKFADATKKATPLVDQIDKIVDRFTADTKQATQAAMAYSVAIEQVGGASHLTATQHAEVTRAVEKANSAYKAMGQDAPAHLRVLQRDLSETASKTSSVVNAVSGLSTAVHAFMGLAVVQQIARIGGAALTTAGNLTDLATQTGASASSLHSIQRAASEFGVGIDRVSTIIVGLNDHLGSGEKNTIASIERLGLSLQVLQAQSPDAAFLSIVEALAKIPDPLERTSLALDALGPRAKDALKLVDEGFVANARAMRGWSEGTIRDLDDAGDAWQRLQNDVESVAGQIIAQGYRLANDFKHGQWGLAFQSLKFVLGGAGAIGPPVAPFSFNPATPTTFSLGGATGAGGSGYQSQGLEGFGPNPGLVNGVSGFDEVIEAYEKALASETRRRGVATETTKELSAQIALLRSMPKVIRGIPAGFGVSVFGSENPNPIMMLSGRGDAVSTRTPTNAFQLGNAISLGGFVGTGATPTRTQGLDWGGMLSQLPAQLASVFASGGNARQVGGGIGSLAGGLGGTLAASGLGLAAGSFLGSAVPVIGTLIGGFLGKKLGGLFGPSANAVADRQATSNIQTTQAGLIDRYRSVENIAGMTQAGAELAAGWGHQGRAGEAAFNAQLKAFEASLQRQSDLKADLIDKERSLKDLEAERAALVESLVPKWASVKSILDEYGISLEGAGLKVQQLAATDDWTTMINKIQTLERAGVDSGHMINGMADEISKAVQQALKFGTEVPANMRHYIDALMAAGLLVDENGQKITDLSNLKWGDKVATEADKTNERIDAMTAAIDEFRSAIDDIVAALRDLLPAAAGDAARGVQDEWDRNRPRLGYETGEYPGGNRGSGDPTSTVDVPGAANGVLAGGPRGAKFRIFGEREPELGGSVDFMSRVLSKAMDLTGGMAGGMRLENVVVIDGKVAARALSGPLVRNLHARKLLA